MNNKQHIRSILFLGMLMIVPTVSAQWSDPVNLGHPINSQYNDLTATLSKDGRSLYFSSNRPCGDGDVTLDFNIWVSERASEDSVWSDPVCLEINVDGFEDSAPAFSRDDHWMYFTSNRPGGFGTPGTQNGRDIWISWRSQTHDVLGWSTPFNAGAMLNSTLADAGASFFANEDAGTPQLFFTSNRNGNFDIFVSEQLPNGQFASPTLVTELNTPDVEARPSIRHDGLELFFFRGIGVGPYDLYSARRPDTSSPWSTPTNLGVPINTTASEDRPSISADRRTLLFTSDRALGFGGFDIWMTVRPKQDIH
jgi:Tol biopolymer transport system component